MEKVKLTVHVTAEAAGILFAYAGDRNRGEFLSQLLIAQRARDDAEGVRVAAELARKAAAEAARKAHEATAAARVASGPSKGPQRRSKRHGGRK